jgi:hypothetical protein
VAVGTHPPAEDAAPDAAPESAPEATPAAETPPPSGQPAPAGDANATPDPFKPIE